MAKNRKAKPTASKAKATTPSNASPSSSQPASTLPTRSHSPPPLVIEEEEDMDDEPPVNRQPFRFFDLPSELRLRIYEEVFHITERHVMELYEGKQRAGNIIGLDERPDPPLDLGESLSYT